MYKSFFKYSIFLAFALPFLLFACNKKERDNNKQGNKKDSIPDIYITNINLKQSESGNITLHLSAPLMVRYNTGEAYSEFPKGFKIESFDSLNRKKTELTANYGISWESRNLMQAKGNVIVKNLEKELTLKTEELFWDKNTKKVYSKKDVSITSPTKTIFGSSMESNDLFENWQIPVDPKYNSTFKVDESKSKEPQTNNTKKE